MLRTMMTCVELFKDHPSKEDILFVVLPIIKEGAHLCNDFMRGPFKEQIIDKFSSPENCHGLKFDFTYIVGCYGCESILQFNLISEVKSMQSPYSMMKPEEMPDKVGTMNQAIDWVLDAIYEQFPLRIEFYEACWMRACLVKQFMKTFFLAPQHKHLLKEKSHKVGVVSHSTFLRSMSGTGYDPVTNEIIDSCDMKNCEIFPSVNF